tara:strand:+ start:1799 stop:3763 length:1965 start_codon:yes stop_codon:yes gene_type:complete
MKINNILIIQARINSKRFPMKVMKKINGKTLIEIMLNRLKRSKYINKIVFAIPNNKENQNLYNFLKKLSCNIHLGNEKNVLKRFFYTAKKFNADNIVRITSDCPLVDYQLVDKMLKFFLKSDFDYISNILIPTYPDGLDVEILSKRTLFNAYKNAKTKFDKEHVTTFIRKSENYKKFNYMNNDDYSEYRLTVDHKEDFRIIKKIFDNFSPKIYFKWEDVINLSKRNPKILRKINFIKRKKLFKETKTQKLWSSAQTLIPGGNMFLSKNPDRFLPNQWPAYFSKSKKCFIWDLDNKKYVDMSVMGVGTNILGYSNPLVDKAVKKVINDGNLTTLNCKEEVKLAERLIDMHRWADMVRFTRTGGEANALAIRISRATTNKQNIAICGYHGWHDWYLSSNLQNPNNLTNFLMKDLKTTGVPDKLRNTVHPFQYNNFKQLSSLISKKNIGTIIMEVERNEKPKNNFLKKIRNLATKKNIILIFDETTSGFRSTFGGLHKMYNVNPDIAIFGKALGNGYSISAILGKREIMENTNKSFVSSTFWSERIGLVASLKTLEIMEKIKSWEIITKKGNLVKRSWRSLAKKHNLKINVYGLPALPKFYFINKDSDLSRKILTQEMLKSNILATSTVFLSIEHTREIINKYLSLLNKTFKIISHI